MNTETSFGDWVRRRRKALDLTQEQLADLVGCSHSAIRKFETGERRPSVQIAELLAKHLEITDEQRPLFLKVARGDARMDKLPAPSSGLEFAPTSPTFIPPTNLPTPATPFIGRGQDIASLTRLIHDPHCRLVTLLGQGGMGKTRLSIQVAAQLLDDFDGRVYFFQLASLPTAEAILPALASFFGLVAPNADLKARLIGYLREKHALFVLDNFEHLIQGAELLSELLSQAPRLKLLVTSRERLNLLGEWTLELSGLTSPPETGSNFGSYDALTLFEQSASRACPEIQFSAVERAAAIRICNLVEGLPLAIELAAAWLNVLSCVDIAREIEKNFDFLKTSQRNLPERHRSLRAAFEHSWRLLTDEERVALANFSVFRGGFSRDAAHAIAGASLEVLSSLIAKSLVRRAENGRFDMHEAIRQYASEHLADEASVRELHGKYYLSLLRDSETALKGSQQFDALRTLTDEFGNIQVAWGWGVTHHAFGLLNSTLPALWLSYDMRGWLGAGLEQTGAMIKALRPQAETTQFKVALGQALAFHGMFLFRAGDYARAKSALEEAIQILRPLNLPQALKPALIFNSIVTSLMGDVSQAQRYIVEGVEIARLGEDAWMLALGQFNQGFQLNLLGQRLQAYELMRVGLQLWREMGNARFSAMALNFLSPVAIALDRRGEARSFLEESLRLTSTLKDRWGMGTALGQLGSLNLLEGNLAEAQMQLEQSIAIFTELGARWDMAWAWMQLGKLHLCCSDFSLAEDALKHSLRLSLEAKTAPLVVEAAIELADCLFNLSRIQEASAILNALPDLSSMVDSVRRRVDDLRSDIPAAGNGDAKLEDVLLNMTGQGSVNV